MGVKMLLRELPDWVEKNKDLINETAIEDWKISGDTKEERAACVLYNVKRLSEEFQNTVTSIEIPYFDMSELEFSEFDPLLALGSAMKLDGDNTGIFLKALLLFNDLSPALQLLREVEYWEIDDAFSHAPDFLKESWKELYEVKRIVDLV